MHSSPDRVVWFDLPVADLERASRFYGAVLEHGPDGNGGCLIPNGKDVSPVRILVYMNVDGRIRDAVRQVEKLGGRVLEPVKGIGPHGFRAIVLDSEGNRIGLHSNTDK
jgi:predicted enzyme related to lactoylglutathione lyase